MAITRPDIVEMPEDPAVGAMPWYRHLVDWAMAETAGLTDAQLDYDDHSPDREWMWWSIRRQVSHMAWDALVFTKRRCGDLLWPDGAIPEPIVWADHQLGRDGAPVRWDRVLDEDLYWELPDLFDKLGTGIDWLTRVVEEQSIESLRATTKTVRGNPFWAYVITTLPRGAGVSPDDERDLAFDLEGSLWMVFYEMACHVRTIQRLKIHQGLDTQVELPRVGYLRLPHYWGDTSENGPGMTRF